MLRNLRSDFALSDAISSSTQLFASSEPIQIQLPIHRSVPIESITYPASAYQWLLEVLDGLIDFGNQHGHYGIINLTEEEYQWLDDVLEELICSVGDNENHLLAPLMELVIRLINDYEDAYVAKLIEQSPKLAEEETIENVSEDELAAYAFFSMGYLLWQGNKKEESVSAYDKVITLEPDFAEAYVNRGMAKIKLKRIDDAKSDFQTALKLAEQQGQEELKAFIEEQLQELNNSKSQDRENKEEI